MVNEQLLRNVIKRIEREAADDGWNQDVWGHLDLKADQASPGDAGLERKEFTNHFGTPFSAYTLSDMTSVSCGTSFCLAGHTILEAGESLIFSSDEDDAEVYSHLCLTQDGEIKHIQTRAAELLGVPEFANIFEPGYRGPEGLKAFKSVVERETGVKLD